MNQQRLALVGNDLIVEEKYAGAWVEVRRVRAWDGLRVATEIADMRREVDRLRLEVARLREALATAGVQEPRC